MSNASVFDPLTRTVKFHRGILHGESARLQGAWKVTVLSTRNRQGSQSVSMEAP